MRKSKKVATFFAMFPGAGHMYLGLTNQGIQLMLVFLFTCFLSSRGGMDFISLLLPVIWFYSIFDVRSKVMSDVPVEDCNLKIFSKVGQIKNFNTSDSYEKYFGFFLIIAGVWAIIDNFVFPLINRYVDPWIVSDIKSVLASLIFIGVGMILIFKNKKQTFKEEGEENCREGE